MIVCKTVEHACASSAAAHAKQDFKALRSDGRCRPSACWITAAQFLPQDDEDIKAIAKEMIIPVEAVRHHHQPASST